MKTKTVLLVGGGGLTLLVLWRVWVARQYEQQLAGGDVPADASRYASSNAIALASSRYAAAATLKAQAAEDRRLGMDDSAAAKEAQAAHLGASAASTLTAAKIVTSTSQGMLDALCRDPSLLNTVPADQRAQWQAAMQQRCP